MPVCPPGALLPILRMNVRIRAGGGSYYLCLIYPPLLPYCAIAQLRKGGGGLTPDAREVAPDFGEVARDANHGCYPARLTEV